MSRGYRRPGAQKPAHRGERMLDRRTVRHPARATCASPARRRVDQQDPLHIGLGADLEEDAKRALEAAGDRTAAALFSQLRVHLPHERIDDSFEQASLPSYGDRSAPR